VRAMWLMLQQDAPEDYVIGTGEAHSVRDLCQIAFETLGMDYQDYVIEDPQYFRLAEEKPLVANPTKAKQNLGWVPEVDFTALIQRMVLADLEALQ